MKMGKLEDYYKLFDMFKGHLTREQKDILRGLEDQIIKDEILPAISMSVAPVLSALRRNLILVVDYDTETGVTVKTTREQVVMKEKTVNKYEIPSTENIVKAAEMNQKGVLEHHQSPSVPITRGESVGFRVKLPNGKVIYKQNAKETLIDTLKFIGLEKASTFKERTFAGYRLVGHKKRNDGTHKWQEKVGEWYVYVNMSNEIKIKTLYQISKELGIKLEIEKLK